MPPEKSGRSCTICPLEASSHTFSPILPTVIRGNPIINLDPLKTEAIPCIVFFQDDWVLTAAAPSVPWLVSMGAEVQITMPNCLMPQYDLERRRVPDYASIGANLRQNRGDTFKNRHYPARL